MTEKKTETNKHNGVVAALVAFQSEMKTVGKDKVNPHFKSRYADISSITEEVAPLLTKHGLAFTCLPRQADGGGYEIVGKLMHETGDWLEGSLPLFGNDAQKIGSSITYARRYLLGSITGVVTGDEDDDGNDASTSNERARASRVNRAASEPRATPEQIMDEIFKATTRDQVRKLWEQYNVSGAPKEFQAQVQQYAASLPEDEA